MYKWILVLGLIILASCSPAVSPDIVEQTGTDIEIALFAGGCFWCMEPPFESLAGVHSVVSGFAGGQEVNPSYKEVSSGSTGHTEVVQITFDPEIISYEELLYVYWKQVNPTDIEGQFVDRGAQYRPEIFYTTEMQRVAAELSKQELIESGIFGEEILVAISPATDFYAAEEYHQDYYSKNPVRYKYYRSRSGRDQFLESVWTEENDELFSYRDLNSDFVRPSDEELREQLTELEYYVTQEEGTERPFDNEYWDNKEAGIYVDIVSGEALFSSLDKYESGTGWPSFTQPLETSNIVLLEDRKLLSVRTEVRSRVGDSHLGHVFADGPQPTGLRYCMNSAALRFVPVENLESEGYGEYLYLFE